MQPLGRMMSIILPAWIGMWTWSRPRLCRKKRLKERYNQSKLLAQIICQNHNPKCKTAFLHKITYALSSPVVPTREARTGKE